VRIMREAVSLHNLILTLLRMFVLHVYSMTLQWIRVMQHRLGCVAPEEGQHISSMHLPSN